jgi:hypothetical protein
MVVRHRLNRSGDRPLNRALHTVILVRMRQDPVTKAYVERRVAEGKSVREVKRCLKRYVARQLFRQLLALPVALQDIEASPIQPASYAGVVGRHPRKVTIL